MLAHVFNGLLACVNFVSAELVPHPKHRRWVSSFSAGVAVSYLFVQLFPELVRAVGFGTRGVFLMMLFGFSSYYIAEQVIVQHSAAENLRKFLHNLHIVGFSAYHVIVGLVVWKLAQDNVAQAFLFFVAIAFFTFITSQTFEELHRRGKRESLWNGTVVALAFPFGGLIGQQVGVSENVFFLLLSFLAGALTYVLVKEILPARRRGDALCFALGVVSYTVVLALLSFSVL